jgi:hypothetical protein
LYNRLWISGNAILVFFLVVYIWFLSPHDSSMVVLAQILAQLAVILFIVNVNMYFIFLVIRNTSKRQVKIRLAKLSRILMKWHIRIGITGAILILTHAVINLSQMGSVLGYTHLKLISGYLAISLLTLTLIAGYLRHKKASGFRRKFHLASAIVFMAACLVHIFTLV